MTDPNDMSRDDLISEVKSLRDHMLRMGSSLPMARCPFCQTCGYVPLLKAAVRSHLAEAWAPDVTETEYDAYMQKLQEQFTPKPKQP